MMKGSTLFKVWFAVLFIHTSTVSAYTVTERADTSIAPRYKRSSYANESVELKNEFVRLQVFKRIDGWAWGEISEANGKLMAILDHLGEIMLRDQDIPMRMTADTFRKTTGMEGESLHFDVSSIVVREKLAGTSFEEWMKYPLTEPCLTGEVTITLSPDKPLIHLTYRLKSTGNYYAQYIRGPWLKVGEGSFGIGKDDSILPGVEWTLGDEWSSGTDYFKDPWALRVAPHPKQVAIPLMALSHEGTGIGLSWDPNQVAARWFNYRTQNPQPVFATPNFVDRMNNSLMGLMIPEAVEGRENEVYASEPLELRIGQEVNFDADIWLSKGNSLDVVTDWVKQHDLPKPPSPKWTFEKTLDLIANAYNSNFWHEGKGFGIKQKDQISTRVPAFLERYVDEHKGSDLAKELRKKMDWCYQQAGGKAGNKEAHKEAVIKRGDDLLAVQRDDGSFYFDPHGRHYRKDDFIVATSFVEPMGREFDTALDIVILPALDLLDIAKETGDTKYRDAAKKALDYALSMTRPEGGDFWETPLHAANLLAAGHAAIAYYEGYKAFQDESYKNKAIYWMRTILPFTNLWQPKNQPNVLYYTKPVFSSSDWYFANWVRDHVQWEVLSVFRDLGARNIQWGDIDTEIDWRRFHEGITVAAIEWMIVHTDDSWRPHNIPATYTDYQEGAFDYTFPDTHNSITGNYGGMFIMPEPIAFNIYSLLDDRKK